MSLNRIFINLFMVAFFSNINLLIAQKTSENISTKMQTTLIQPSYLKAGDTVAIVAPSGILNNRNREVNQAIDLLKSWGLNVIVGDHVFKKDNHSQMILDYKISQKQIAIHFHFMGYIGLR